MKLAFKIGVAGLVLTAGAATFGLLAEHLFIDALDRRVEEKTGLKVHFAKTDLGFWPALHFTGDDLRLSDPESNREPVFAADRVSFDLSWNSLISGQPRITNATLIRPKLSIAEGGMHRASPSGPENKMSRLAEDASIDGVTIRNASVTVSNPRRAAEMHVDAIDLRVQMPENGALELTGSGRFGSHDTRFSIEAASVKDLAEGTQTTFKTELEITDLTTAPLNLRGKVRLTDRALRFESGAEQPAVNEVKASGYLNWAKDVPFLSMSLVSNELNIAASGLNSLPVADLRDRIDELGHQPLDLGPSRLIDTSLDATVKILKAGPVRAGSLQAKATLNDGLLKATLQSGDFYQGSLRADLAIDGNQQTPGESLDLRLANVSVLPLLADSAHTAKVDGKLDMTVALKTAGTSARAMASALTGTSTLHFHDGGINGIDVPSMAQAILAYLPPAWRNITNRVDISKLDATFAITEGTAATNDLHIVSPIIDARGKGNIGLADQTFDLRFEPKVVTQASRDATAANKPSTVSPLDLGAAILIRGSWANPQISADLSGLLNDPQAAIEKIGTLGQEFLGKSGGNGVQMPNGMPNDETMKGITDMLGGLLGGMQDQPRKSRR